jgi:hypothetical protein
VALSDERYATAERKEAKERGKRRDEENQSLSLSLSLSSEEKPKPNSNDISPSDTFTTFLQHSVKEKREYEHQSLSSLFPFPFRPFYSSILTRERMIVVSAVVVLALHIRLCVLRLRQSLSAGGR